MHFIVFQVKAIATNHMKYLSSITSLGIKLSVIFLETLSPDQEIVLPFEPCVEIEQELLSILVY